MTELSVTVNMTVVVKTHMNMQVAQNIGTCDYARQDQKTSHNTHAQP